MQTCGRMRKQQHDDDGDEEYQMGLNKRAEENIQCPLKNEVTSWYTSYS